MSDEKRAPIVTALVPSVFRRVFGSTVLVLAGILAIYIIGTQPPDGLQWSLVIALLAVFFFYGAHRMWEATGHRIELSDDGLYMSNGVVIAAMVDIHKVDRSFYAFKPSNGFLVTLNKTHDTKWVPGLWWRFGKRLGIGGLTSGPEGKIMADTLSVMIAERDGLLDVT